MKQLLETMCGGDFLSKNPEEAMDFLNYVAETSKAWDEPNPREVERETYNQLEGRHVFPPGGHGNEGKAIHLSKKVEGARNEKST